MTELSIPCPSSAVTLPQGWRPAGVGVAEGAAGRSAAGAREKAGQTAAICLREGLKLAMPDL